MKKKPQELRTRIRGAILGCAVADAVAFPYQHYSRAFLRAQVTPPGVEFIPHHSGFYPLGQYSDDTQLMLAVVDSIIENEVLSGENLASHVVPLWRDNLLVERDESCAEPMLRLVKGLAQWDACGLEPGHAEVSPVTRGIGVALWKGDDLEALCGGVEVAVIITHRDPRVLACAAIAAAAVAHNVRTSELILGPFLDQICTAAAYFDCGLADALLDFPRILSMTDYRAIKHFETLRPDDHYPPSDEGLGNYCVPALWTSLYSFLKAPYDYQKCIESCIRAGGHVDSPACIAGAMVGALVGEEGIPAALRQGVLGSDRLSEKADALHQCPA